VKNSVSGMDHARNQEYIHRVNVKNGWFDKPVSLIEAVGLFITEVVEVADAHDDEGLRGGWQAPAHMASEFADCYIRLADACSRFGVDLGLVVDSHRHSYASPYQVVRSFNSVCMQLIRRARDVIELYREHGLESIGAGEFVAGAEIRRAIAYLYLQLQDACDQYGVNLMEAFSLKMAVNETRGYHHGNKQI
jgi:hypothetical protein